MSDKLPALWVAEAFMNRGHGHGHFEYLVSRTLTHEDQEPYIPASAIRALIEKPRDTPNLIVQMADAEWRQELEQLLSEYEGK